MEVEYQTTAIVNQKLNDSELLKNRILEKLHSYHLYVMINLLCELSQI